MGISDHQKAQNSVFIPLAESDNNYYLSLMSVQMMLCQVPVESAMTSAKVCKMC